MKSLLVIVSAPSGTGKTTIVRELIARMSAYLPITQAITYTSREMRAGEEAGVDYHWISPAEFEQKIQEGFFLEWSAAYGAYYGTPRTILQDIAKGVTVILVIDRAGARQIKELIPDALTVWLTVPSLDELRRRLETRARDSQEQIERRLEIAKRELEEEKKYQFYAYSIENSKKESTIIALENMIVESIKSSI